MARPIRLEFSGALYHVTSRGDGREAIYLSDDDRLDWLSVLGQVCKRFNWVVHAWCQMTNHYHLLIETPEGNLSAGMRQLKPSREIPRLCRGGSRSLTFAGVHRETSRVSRQAHSLKGASRWTNLKA